MRTKRRVFLRAFAIAVCLFHIDLGRAWAQSEGTVRGEVVAAADGSVLAGATATLRPDSAGEPVQIQTDAGGRFSFPQVKPGWYVLSVSSAGFGTRDMRFILEPREVRTIPVSLEVARVTERVDVSSNPTSIPGTHSPSSTTLTLDRLDAMPVFQRTTLADAIVTLAPGMIRGHDDFVHIRGHEVALNPVIEGVSFWENAHALFSAGISPDIIETANVMTGGFAAEYGNRFGGVVDIVTRSGFRMEHRGAATISGGGAGRGRAAVELGGSRGPFGYFVYGSLFGSERFLSPPAPDAIHDEARGAHAFVQVERGIGRLGSVKAILIGDGTNFEIPTTPRDVELRPLATPRQETRQQTAIVGWMRAWGDVAVTASFYERHSRARLLPASGPLTAEAQLDRTLLTIGGKIDVTRFTERHTLKAGIDAVRLRPSEDLAYRDTGYLAFTHLVGLPHIHAVGEAITFAGAETGGQISAYVQDGIQVSSRVTADIGLRVDRYGLVVSDTHASPRLNLAFRIGDGTVLHTSYNHFFVPPPVEGVLSSSAGLTRSIEEIGVALAPLEPTVEDQIEAGVTTGIGSVQLAVTGYYRTTDNPVHTTVWPDSRIYSYASFDRARAYGLEAKADAKLPGIIAYLNYALGRVDFYNPVTGGFVTEAAHLTETSRFLAPMDQTHTLTGGATYRHALSGLWVGGAIEYGSGTPMGHGASGHDHGAGDVDHEDPQSSGTAPRVPAHFVMGAAVGFDVIRDVNGHAKLTFQVNLENVANNVYLIAQEGEFSPAQFSIPRLLSVTVKFHF